MSIYIADRRNISNEYLISTLLTFEQLHKNADATLFKKIFNSDHCLHHLLPPVMSLHAAKTCSGRRSCELPLCKYTTFKRSLITRRLFTDND